MAAPITYRTVVAAAGGDPHEIALPMLTANASEVEALGTLFCSAADRTGDIEKWAIDGYGTAITAAVIADATPMDLMSEVVESQKTLDLGSGNLSLIGASMHEIAARIPLVQQQLAETITASHQVVALAIDAYEFGIAGQSDPVIIEQLKAQCWGGAVQQMSPIIEQIKTIVQSYDEFLTDRLSLLQKNFDYLAPKSLSDGAISADSAQMLNLTEQVPRATTSPGVVSLWWASLSVADQVALMSQSGSALAVLHGLPASVYNALNRREVTDELANPDERKVAEAQYEVDVFMAQYFPGLTPDEIFDGPKSAELNGKYPQLAFELNALVTALAAATATAVAGGARAVQQSLSAGSASKYLLEFHPDTNADDDIEDSQAVVAVGNPDTANNLVLEVPGTSNSALDCEDLVATAEQTKSAMEAEDVTVANAVISYMGYDAPDTITEAISPDYGQNGAAALSADLLGYDAANCAVNGKTPNLTVIGHSYGAYLSGLALSDNAPEGMVDNFIYMGAPGLGVESVGELNVASQNVYGVMNGLDPVPLLGTKSNAVGGQFGPSPYPQIGPTYFGGQYLDGTPVGLHDYYDKWQIMKQLAEVAVAD